jgi:mRNA interferase MazF
VSRGEVWWADVPGVGRRPVVILTRDRGIPFLSGVTVALVTTNVRGIPSEVQIGIADGMPKESAVNLENLYTIPRRQLKARIATLPASRMSQVCAALRFAVAC